MGQVWKLQSMEYDGPELGMQEGVHGLGAVLCYSLHLAQADCHPFCSSPK